MILRGTEGVSEEDGAMLTVTVGNSDVTSAGKMATGGIRRKNRGREGRGEVAGYKNRASKGRDAEVTDMSGAVSAPVSHAKGGRPRNRATVPEQVLLVGCGDHGATVHVGTASRKPGGIRGRKMLVGGHTVTISKRGHVNKSVGKGAGHRRTRGRRGIPGGIAVKTGQSEGISRDGGREGLNQQLVRVMRSKGVKG